MRNIVDIKEHQELLLDVLKHFKKTCDTNDLRYFLSNGTLLGAIKYQGFIPWDDDIDVFMPRSDFERLLDLSDVDTDDYTLLAYPRVKEWRVPFAKLSSRKTLIQENSANFGVELGVSIDIFPLDNWCGGKLLSTVQARYCSLLRRFVSASIEENFSTSRTGIERAILKGIWKYGRMRGSSFFFKKIQKESERGKSNITPAYMGSVSWALYGVRELIPSHVFSDSIQVRFEDGYYPAPVGYDRYLWSLYGDYHQDPPVEKRKTHNISVWRKEG